MKKGKFKLIIYLISCTVLLTVGIQVYRNIQNYQLNKERFIKDVQTALDNGVESYYAFMAKTDVLKFKTEELDEKGPQIKKMLSGAVSSSWSTSADSLLDSIGKSKPFMQISMADSIVKNGNLSFGSIHVTSYGNSDRAPKLMGYFSKDSIPSSIKIRKVDSVTKSQAFEEFTKMVIISLTRDTVDFKKLNKGVLAELDRRNLNIDYRLKHFKDSTLKGEFTTKEGRTFDLSTVSNSSFLPKGQSIEIDFPNSSLIILKRGMADMLISLLICLAVIGSLLYLYRIINQQKQLAEIKNDLISNITHEFKTPIATVNSALEGIANFNRANDPAKTAKYLSISNQQLEKLNLMVEKLLETATLDSEDLKLRKEPLNFSQMLHTMIEKYKMVGEAKFIRFLEHQQDVIVEADPFHLENAISNLIDNAIKYGGDEITVSLDQKNGFTQVVVQDNGGFIEKSQKERIFDKFYRIPKGNQHDVKGFGIGLYYTKSIIEKHGGSIKLILKPQLTSFEIAI